MPPRWAACCLVARTAKTREKPPISLPLLWNFIAMWREPCINMQWALAMSWLIMTAVQDSLFVLHPALDNMLNTDTHQILDRLRFRSLHNTYLTVSTVQWAAGLLHVWWRWLYGGVSMLAA